MSNIIQVNPGFNPANQSLFFRSKELNAFTRPNYVDTFGVYQNLFGAFDYMKLDSRGDFTVHRTSGIPLMWQKYESCSMDPTKNIIVRSRTIRPERAYAKSQWCHDQMFDSCFEHLIKYDGGDVGLDSEGSAILGNILSELRANMNLAARYLLTMGQVYDTSNPAAIFDPLTPISTQELFLKTSTAVQGWVKLFAALADEGEAHLNVTNLIPNDSAGACDLSSTSILDIYDKLLCEAKPQLKQLVNQGGAIISNTTGQKPFAPIVLMDGNLYNALANEKRAQDTQIAQNNPRISVREINNGGLTPTKVYYIDEVPVMPLYDINGFDQFTNGKQYFMGIVASGNIQLGMAYDTMPNNIEDDGIGMLVQRNTNLAANNYGLYTVAAWNLFQVSLADPDFAVATQRNFTT